MKGTSNWVIIILDAIQLKGTLADESINLKKPFLVPRLWTDEMNSLEGISVDLQSETTRIKQ